MDVAFGRCWRKTSVCRIILEVREGKKLLEIARHRRENNIKKAAKGRELESTIWIRLCQDMEQCLGVKNTVKGATLFDVRKSTCQGRICSAVFVCLLFCLLVIESFS